MGGDTRSPRGDTRSPLLELAPLVHRRAMADRTLNPDELRRVAALAHLDPRTVKARLEGRRQASTTSARVDDALRQLGFAVPDRATPTAGTQAA